MIYMENLYPLKFVPLLKEKIWGGKKLVSNLHKPGNHEQKIGESWEISGLEHEISIVSNGFLQGNSLQDLIEVYMGDLVGDCVYEKFGIEFPLLIKFIDANDVLSIQVHPDDEKALERHSAYGKTEMWYVLDAEENASLINGFKSDIDSSVYQQALNKGKLEELLNFENVKKGDVYFIPAGRVHAIGSGILLAEIQQTSDITYRIYDWGRLDNAGIPRELHTELALDVIDFKAVKKSKTIINEVINHLEDVVECQYFKTSMLVFDKPFEKDYNQIDSFIIFICTEGHFKIQFGQANEVEVNKGETILVPAILKNLTLVPGMKTKILEVYLPENKVSN